MPTKKLTFANADGHRLAALLEMPETGSPAAYGIFAHCFTCSKNYRAVRNISRALAGRGIAMLSFDFAGLGESTGNFEETTFSSNVADLVIAAEFLEESYAAPQLLVGHSMGGSAIIQAAKYISSARAVVTIASPSETTHLRSKFPAQFRRIDESGSAEVSIGGVKFRLRREFVADLESQRMDEAVAHLGRPLLIVNSAADATIDLIHGEKMYRAAKAPKGIVTLELADHLLSSPRDSEHVAAVIVAWADRYMKL